jgi:hypothetical protein
MYVYLNIISVKMLRRFVLGEAILEVISNDTHEMHTTCCASTPR